MSSIEDVHRNILGCGERGGFDQYDHDAMRDCIADELRPHPVAQRTEVKDFLCSRIEDGLRATEIRFRSAHEECALACRELVNASEDRAFHDACACGCRDPDERLDVLGTYGAVLDDEPIRERPWSDFRKHAPRDRGVGQAQHEDVAFFRDLPGSRSRSFDTRHSLRAPGGMTSTFISDDRIVAQYRRRERKTRRCPVRPGLLSVSFVDSFSSKAVYWVARMFKYSARARDACTSSADS